MALPIIALVLFISGCTTGPDAPSAMGKAIAVVKKDIVAVPAGPFIMGSTENEKELGYQLDENRGSRAARRYHWFENETRRQLTIDKFFMDQNLVTNQDYKRFIEHSNHPAPAVDILTWQSYGLIHPYKTTRRFIWQNKTFPVNRGQHPVVLIDYEDALSYCQWRGNQEGRDLTLPTEAQWEKAARGHQGLIWPWGNVFDAQKLNSQGSGPYDTVPVGQYPTGRSPYGINDMAGMVFEWTRSPCPDNNKTIVKGGSWDDLPGVTRSAAKHCRPLDLKHVLIGFRCVHE